jgi:putative protease
MAKMKVGKVTHYYDKIKVAIVELNASLAVGDQIVLERGGEELFKQKVASMQIEHKKVKEAKKGDVIGLEVDELVKEGAEVYKL